MNIFNVQIFGSDAEWFMDLSCEEKKQWILDNTNQADENLIKEFIENARIDKNSECLGCQKAKENGNISKGISKEVEPINASETSGNSVGTDTKRRRNSKKS